MRKKRTLLLLGLIFTLVVISLFFVMIISNGTDPLVALNLRAAGDDQYATDPLLSQLGTGTTDPTTTPTITYNSTSPTLAPTNGPGGATTPSLTSIPADTSKPTIAPPTPTNSPTPTVTQAPVNVEPTAIPTTVSELPVAGIADTLHPAMIIGGGVLVVLALLF